MSNGVLILADIENQITEGGDDVLSISKVSTYSNLPSTGVDLKIYITSDTGIMYRWNGTGYSPINDALISAESSARESAISSLQSLINGINDPTLADSTINDNATITSSHRIVRCNGDVIVTLDSLSTFNNAQRLIIKNVSFSANVTIQTTNPDTIDGETSIVLYPGETLELEAASSWTVI